MNNGGCEYEKIFISAIYLFIALFLVLSIVPFITITARAAGTVDDFVERCYTVTLERESDPDGFADWKGQLLNGKAVGIEIAYGFLFSPEYTGKNKSNEDYVTDLYMLFMGREPDTDGFNDWVGQLNNGKTRLEVFAGFANSQEFYNICDSYGITAGRYVFGYDRPTINNVNLFVERLYKTCLGRIGDKDGQKNWVEKLIKKQISGSECARSFIFSAEYTNKGLSDDEFVENLYIAMMGRPSDEGGKQNWLNALASGKTRDEVFAGFANSTEFAGICNTYKIDKGNYVAKDIGKEVQKIREISEYYATRSNSGVLEMEFSSEYNYSTYKHYCFIKENGEVIMEFNRFADRRLFEDGHFYVSELNNHWFGGRNGLTYHFTDSDSIKYKILGYNNEQYLVERKSWNNASLKRDLLLMDSKGGITKTCNVDFLKDNLYKGLYYGDNIWIIQMNQEYESKCLIFNSLEEKSFTCQIYDIGSAVVHEGIVMIHGCRIEQSDFKEIPPDYYDLYSYNNNYYYDAKYLGEGYWLYNEKLYRYDVNSNPITLPEFNNISSLSFRDPYFASQDEYLYFSHGYIALNLSGNDESKYVTIMDGNGKVIYNPIKAGEDYVQSDGKLIASYMEGIYLNDTVFYLVDKQGHRSKKLNVPYYYRMKDFDGKYVYFEEGIYSLDSDTILKPFYSEKTFVTEGSESIY